MADLLIIFRKDRVTCGPHDEVHMRTKKGELQELVVSALEYFPSDMIVRSRENVKKRLQTLVLGGSVQIEHLM